MQGKRVEPFGGKAMCLRLAQRKVKHPQPFAGRAVVAGPQRRETARAIEGDDAVPAAPVPASQFGGEQSGLRVVAHVPRRGVSPRCDAGERGSQRDSPEPPAPRGPFGGVAAIPHLPWRFGSAGSPAGETNNAQVKYGREHQASDATFKALFRHDLTGHLGELLPPRAHKQGTFGFIGSPNCEPMQ